jgi:cyanophycin synthetase
VMYFGSDCRSAVISAHLAAGKRAVYLSGDGIVLAEGSHEIPLVRSADIPATRNGLIPFQVQNAMAAAAACWAGGVPLQVIRLGLRTFQADAQLTPGRFNLFDAGEFQVLLDYAHNPHALCALQEAVRQMRPRRTVCVLAAPGDRRDVDLAELGRVAASGFDALVVREDEDRRGRKPGEAADIIAASARAANPAAKVEIVLEEPEAVSRAVSLAREGDIVVVLADQVSDSLGYINSAIEEHTKLLRREPRLFRLPRTHRHTNTPPRGLKQPHDPSSSGPQDSGARTKVA